MFDSGESPAAPEVSIAIWFEAGAASTAEPQPAEIGFAAPQLIAHALTPGARFFVKEEPRTVAEGWVTGLM